MRIFIALFCAELCDTPLCEVKSHGLILPAAVCGHTALQGKNLRFDAILGEDFYCHKGKRSVFEQSVSVQN